MCTAYVHGFSKLNLREPSKFAVISNVKAKPEKQSRGDRSNDVQRAQPKI